MTTKIHTEYELVPLKESASFVVREFHLPRFTSPWHLHPEIELTLIIAGNGTRFVGDSVAAFRPGDLVMIGSNTPHYWRTADTSTNNAHSIVVQFREDCLGKDFLHLPEMRSVLQLLTHARQGLAFPGKAQGKVASQMKELATLNGAKRVVVFLDILAQLADVRSVKHLSGKSFLSATDFSGHGYIQRACRYVFEHSTEPIRLTDAAKAAALAPETLSRMFKRATGKSFFDFVNDVRIGHACMQLIESDISIGEIAFASGFNSLSNFNRRFLERKQRTPRQFREQHRKDGAEHRPTGGSGEDRRRGAPSYGG